MKTLITNLIVSLLFAGYASLLHAGEADAVKMKLLRGLSQAPEKSVERLKILDKLRFNSTNAQVEAYYTNLLLKEAEAIPNYKYVCKAYLSFMALSYNNYNAVEVNRWMQLLEPIARREKLYDELFQGQRCVVDMYQVTEEYEREEKEANEMLQEAMELDNKIGIILAYQCLSNAYRMTNRSDKAADVLTKAYKVALQIDEAYTIEISKSLISSYTELGDLPNWLKWTQMQEGYLKKLAAKAGRNGASQLRGWFMMTYASFLTYYIEVGDLHQAEKYLKLAEQYNIEGYGTFNVNYYEARCNYFKKTGQLEKALAELNGLAGVFEKVSPKSYGNMLYRSANILSELERYDEALALYKQSNALNDSVEIVIVNKQTEQLMKDYNTEQLVLEHEKIELNTLIASLALVGVALIILILFIIHIYRVKAGLQCSEREMRRMAEAMEQANVAKEMFLLNINSAISVPMNEVVNSSMKLVSGQVTDPEERKTLSELMNKTSAKLMELINNILDLSRLEAGMMKFREEEVDLYMLMHSIIGSLPASVSERLTASVPQGVNFRVHIDASRLQEVINNLLLTSPGPLTLTVETIEVGTGTQLQFCMGGSVLSSGQSGQEITIANEVNRLLVDHFGGHYEVYADTNTVRFTIPGME